MTATKAPILDPAIARLLRAANRPISNRNISAIGWLTTAKAVSGYSSEDKVPEVEFHRKVEQALYNVFNHIQDIRIDLTEGILLYPNNHVWLLPDAFNSYLAKLITESARTVNKSLEIGERMRNLEPHLAQFAVKDAAGKRTVLADMHPVLFGCDHSLHSSQPDPEPTSPRFEVHDEVLEWFVSLSPVARRDGRQLRYREKVRTHCVRRTQSEGVEISLYESMDLDPDRESAEGVVEDLYKSELACHKGVEGDAIH